MMSQKLSFGDKLSYLLFYIKCNFRKILILFLLTQNLTFFYDEQYYITSLNL